MDNFFLGLAVMYGVLSIPLAGYALWCHFETKNEIYKTKIEIDKLKIEINRLDDDIDDLWPDGPDDGGEDNDAVEFSNIVAFGKKKA